MNMQLVSKCGLQGFLDDKFEAHFRLTKNMEEISEFRNSKYTFSFVGTVYSEIIDKLKKAKMCYLLVCHVR